MKKDTILSQWGNKDADVKDACNEATNQGVFDTSNKKDIEATNITVDYGMLALPAPPQMLLELTEREAFLYSEMNTGPLELVRTEKGKILKSSFANYVRVMEGDAYLVNRIRFNLFDGRQMLNGLYWDANPHPIRDNDLANIRYFVDSRYGLGNENNIKDALLKVSCDHPYHPVRELLSNLKWDGVERISNLFPRYLGADKSDYTTAVTKLLLQAAIQRVFNPGCKYDYCVILADTCQGTGKSTMCRFLALNDEWYTDSIGNLNDSKATFELMRGKWIAELGELLAVRKAADVETIKAFITRTSQDYRAPYGVFAENHPRQCVFIGTTNRPNFLPEDKTGNRRFLPIFCNGKEKAERHPLDDETETRKYILQCYAEAMYKGKTEGFSLVLDKKWIDYLAKLQETATPEDTSVGMIQQWLDDCREDYVCSRMIWDEVFNKDSSRQPQKYELRDIADIMNLEIVGWEKYKGKTGCEKVKFNVYGTQRAWKRVASPVAAGVADDILCEFSKVTAAEVPFDDDNKLPFAFVIIPVIRS